MVSQSTQNYSSLKKSTWPHLLLVGQLGQNGSNLVKLVKNLYYLVRVITFGLSKIISASTFSRSTNTPDADTTCP